MYKIEKINKWLVLTNGREVIHGPIENTTETVTESGQPFAIYGDTKEYVVDLAFDQYVEGDLDEGTDEVKILREITWLIGYTLEDAEIAMNDFNTASINAKIQYIKHPERAEYAIPMQTYIFSTVPDGEAKDRMLATATDKVTSGYNLSEEKMVENGWF